MPSSVIQLLRLTVTLHKLVAATSGIVFILHGLLMFFRKQRANRTKLLNRS